MTILFAFRAFFMAEKIEGFGKSNLELLEGEVDAIDREFRDKGITLELQTALDFMLGNRPAGGPYELKITDDSRFKANDYRLGIKLVEYSEDEPDNKEGSVVFDSAVSPSMIGTFMDLTKRREEALYKLNRARQGV